MSLDYTRVDDASLSSFAELAREYCTVVEAYATIEELEFIQTIHGLFARLYAAGISLPSHHIVFDDDTTDHGSANEVEDEPIPFRDRDPDRVTSDELSKMGKISSKLGTAWFYREIFDPHEEDDLEVIGSLADDIVDTYGDLIAGLRKWNRGETGAALWEWRFSFETHWGEHVSGGLRALHTRAAWHDLPWPSTGERARRKR